MTFRQIGTVALDGVSADLQVKYGWHTEATGSAMLDLSPVAPQEKGEDPLRMGKKDGGVGTFTPAKLPLPWEVWTGNGVRKASMDMTTAHRRNRSVAPRSAVVISMAAWKMDHASSPTRRVAR